MCTCAKTGKNFEVCAFYYTRTLYRSHATGCETSNTQYLQENHISEQIVMVIFLDENLAVLSFVTLQLPLKSQLADGTRDMLTWSTMGT